MWKEEDSECTMLVKNDQLRFCLRKTSAMRIPSLQIDLSFCDDGVRQLHASLPEATPALLSPLPTRLSLSQRLRDGVTL